MDVLSRKCKRTIQRHAVYAMPVSRWTAETAHDGVQTRAGEPWMLAKSTQPTRVWATQVTSAVVWPSDISKRVPLHVPAESNCHSTCSNNSWLYYTLVLHLSIDMRREANHHPNQDDPCWPSGTSSAPFHRSGPPPSCRLKLTRVDKARNG